MHSVIAMDENDKPLTSCITWADNRSEGWAHKIKEEMNGHNIYKRTGTPIHPMTPLSKITWIVNEHPETVAKAKNISESKNIFSKNYLINMSLITH